MDISNKYSVFVGTSRGTLQYTNCKPNERVSFSIPEQQSEITALEWGRSDDEIIIGYKNEQVQLYNINLNKYTKTINKLEGEGAIQGVAPLNKAIIVAKKNGIINICQGKKNDFFSINLEEKGSLDCMVLNKSREGVVATGGEFNDLKLWDLETQKNIFKAKSMGHDHLNLPIPTSIRGITFLPDNKLSVCVTKEGHVLCYDERAQRRPVIKFFEKQASYTCVASAFRDHECLVGTTKGYMQVIDLKTPGQCLRTFTCFTGSVTSIVCDPFEALVATTSLDRFMRVHHLETKELVYKVYLKQNLTKILIKPIIKEEEQENNDDVVNKTVDDEYEELFNNMETIVEKKSSKEKRKSETEKVSKKKKKKIKVVDGIPSLIC